SEPSLSLAGNELLVAWRSSAIPGDSRGSELWLRRVPFTVIGNTLTLNPSDVEAPVLRTLAQRAGDQDRFRMALTTLWPSGGIATVWDDASRSFGSSSGGPDVAIQMAPVPNGLVMTWLSPSIAKLNISNDADPLTSGWQGSLSVQTDLASTGATVQFSSDAGNLGAPVAVDATGKATLPSITLPDRPSLTLTATTSIVADRGVGTTSITVLVDTVQPGAIANLSASVPPELRRQTTFRLGWTSPSDEGAAVSTYDVRVSKGTPITNANFDAQERVPYWSTPSTVGAADGVDAVDRLIENNYYFAVAGIDQAGNRGPVSFAGPAAAHFNSTQLSIGIYDELFGWAMEGSTSLDGDAYSDLVVGAFASNTVYIYFGSPNGYPSTPSATIVGEQIINPCVGSNLTCYSFGQTAKIIGDIDSDGLPDLAISSPLENETGNVYIFKGRHPWPTSLTEADADYVVRTVAGFADHNNGYALTGLGDFNGDGIDDFAMGAPNDAGITGRMSVVFGVPRGTPFGTVSLPTDYGTRARLIQVPGEYFGVRAVGVGHVYPGAGTTLVASARSSVHAFHGPGAVQPITVADQNFGVPDMRTGLGLAFL